MHQESTLFWLLVNAVPQGPFTALELHAKLGAGEVTWDSLVCPVGQPSWLPMRSTPSLVPQAQHSDTASVPVVTTPTLTTGVSQQSYLAHPEFYKYVFIGLAMALAGTLLWYIIPNPPSPVEPCYRYFAAKDIVELRSISTPNLHLIFNAMFQGPVHNLGQNMRFIDQSPAPAKFQGHFVSFYFEDLDDNQRIVSIEGVFHLLDKGGWKIEDIYMLSINNRAMDKPVSMAHDYWALIGKEAPGHSKARQAIFTGSEILKWHSDPGYREQLRKSQSSLGKITGREWAFFAVIVVGLCASFMKKNKQTAA